MRIDIQGLDAVARQTLQEQIYRMLRQKLLRGELLPGQPLSINALVHALNASAMPVREALRRLETEHLLVIGANRTLMVPQLNDTEIAELRDIRLQMEGFATERAAPHMTAERIAELERRVGDMTAAIAAGDVHGYLDANWQFHLTIYRASGMPLLSRMIEQLMARAAPFVCVGLGGNESHMTRAMACHRAALEGLRQGGGTAARRAIEQDIRDAARDLLALDGRDG
jgi:DNA-binding GntR family transcriptional regulator